MFCTHLKTIEFADNSQLTVIGKNSFSFSLIKGVTIPSNVTKIDEDAFHYCFYLASILFKPNSSLNSIAENALSSSLITRIVIPPHVTQLEEKTFYNCAKLKSVEFTEDSELHTIKKDAFAGTPIEKIILPKSLKNLEEEWFSYLSGFNSIILLPGNPNFCMMDDKILLGHLYSFSDQFDSCVFACRNIENVLIPSNIARIESYCFYGCEKLQNIEFEPNSSLRSIGKYAFSFSGIRNIKIPKDVSMDEGVFDYCSNLQNISFLLPQS